MEGETVALKEEESMLERHVREWFSSTGVLERPGREPRTERVLPARETIIHVMAT